MPTDVKEPFISHLVQMKQCMRRKREITRISFISHLVQMKHESTNDSYSESENLYIPLGSDETKTNSLLTTSKEEALYPTWFR